MQNADSDSNRSRDEENSLNNVEIPVITDVTHIFNRQHAVDKYYEFFKPSVRRIKEGNTDDSQVQIREE